MFDEAVFGREFRRIGTSRRKHLSRVDRISGSVMSRRAEYVSSGTVLILVLNGFYIINNYVMTLLKRDILCRVVVGRATTQLTH